MDQNTTPPPLNTGDNNGNPKGISFSALLKEDYTTHDRSLIEAGLWALWAHRFGNWRMGVRSKLLRAPLSILYKIMYWWITWFLGIQLDYTVKVGRRVRLWHNGGMVLIAREIGDDVHIRHNTTFGVADRKNLTAKPIIGNRVEVGTGAVILGHVHIGDDAIIGANAVVTKDVAASTLVGGVPAKFIRDLVPPKEAPETTTTNDQSEPIE